MRPLTDSAVPDKNVPLAANSILFHSPRTFIHARIQRSGYLGFRTTPSHFAGGPMVVRFDY